MSSAYLMCTIDGLKVFMKMFQRTQISTLRYSYCNISERGHLLSELYTMLTASQEILNELKSDQR